MSEDRKIRLYLDTSVPSAFYDTSKPVRQLITQKWFENDALSYELFISVITVEEIGKINNDSKKQNISELTLKYSMKILDFSDRAKELAGEYMSKGAIPKSEPQDAYHIAIATINEIGDSERNIYPPTIPGNKLPVYYGMSLQDKKVP